jgi:hypothetical protein|tara:strand:+ start:43187 stop:43444 length:258 start_codon:yes stop_codon:yes gene_type:complete
MLEEGVFKLALLKNVGRLKMQLAQPVANRRQTVVFTSSEFCAQKSRRAAAISRCRVGDAAMRGRCQIVYAMQHLIDEHTIAAPQH